MIRFFTIAASLVLLLPSCTMILSTNIPGKAEKTLPTEWLGKYEVLEASMFRDKRDSIKPEKEFATVESTGVTWISSEGERHFSLNDSLRYSSIAGKGRYLSLLMPQGLFAVFKVTKKGDTLELHSLSADEDVRKGELNRYFDNVDKKKTGDDEYYHVTILDKKLEAYFKSTIPSKEITRLVKLKS